MTLKNPAPSPRRRAADGGSFGKVRAKLHEWILIIQAVTGIVLVVVAVAVAVLAIQARNGALTAHRACERSAKYGPYIAADFERRGIFPTPEIAQAYMDSVPKRSSC